MRGWVIGCICHMLYLISYILYILVYVVSTSRGEIGGVAWLRDCRVRLR